MGEHVVRKSVSAIFLSVGLIGVASEDEDGV